MSCHSTPTSGGGSHNIGHTTPLHLVIQPQPLEGVVTSEEPINEHEVRRSTPHSHASEKSRSHLVTMMRFFIF